MILYRPVGLPELELIYDSGMKAFPARLPQQPVFYPVLQLEYARQIASDWNVKREQLAGYVTEFKVEDSYITQFEEHTVSGSRYREFWIPAEKMEEFNRHLIGHIKVVEAHFGDAFQGFIPEKFALQGKNAVEQFTLLANSYLYKRMDFYLEIKRNHKAVFLNYPFWETYEFKNPGLKEKITKAIKDAWLTSFPQIPLPLPPPVQQNNPLAMQGESDDQVDSDEEDFTTEEQTDSYSLVNPVDEDDTLVRQTESYLLDPPIQKGIPSVERIDSPTQQLVNPVPEEITPVKPARPSFLENPVRAEITLPRRPGSHFVEGIKLGLSGKYHEAIDELVRALEEDARHVVAHTSLGVAFHKAGEDDRALSCYETALKLDTRYAEAHYFRANILYNQGNVREAITGYTFAIGLQPELIEAHERPLPEDRLTDYRLTPAEMYRISRPAHRILDLNKPLESNPRQADLFKERAAEYSRLWNYEQAIADYSSALALDPGDADAFHFRGQAYEQLGQPARAQEDYQRAIAINPQIADEYIHRGVTFGQMGNLRQSILSLTEGIRLAPRNTDAYFNRGTSYLQLGDFQNAIEDFSNVIRLSPNDDAAYYWRGISYEEAGRQREAIADYKQFLALSQDENARMEIAGKLSQWNVEGRNGADDRSPVLNAGQKTNQVQSEKPAQEIDLYALLVALGEQAIHSTWFGSNVNCTGENAKELYALTDQNNPIDGHDLLRIASGIRKTIQGDFQAFEPGEASYWIFLRAWDGNGFYIETDDPQTEEQLKVYFQSNIEEVDGASAPYQGLFLR